jgi:hypothetical protein
MAEVACHCSTNELTAIAKFSRETIEGLRRETVNLKQRKQYHAGHST